MAMLLYFPSGTFSSLDWGLKASAEEITPSAPTDGDGSSESPYQIGTKEELYWFADKVNNENSTYGSANAVLTADVTVNKGTITAASTDATPWTPIGNNSNKYTGTFDGQGHTVSGLYFNDTNTTTGKYVGLFGYVGNGGKVSNVGVENSYFNGYDCVGGVCGYNTSSGTITNCYNTGAVSGRDYVGGVCGYSADTITNCYNTGEVSATSDSASVGGVCGYNASSGAITNCYYLKTEDGLSAVGSNNGSSNVETKTAKQFASGEVAYLLQSGQTADESGNIPEVWGQTIGTDDYPVLGGEKVDATTGCVTYNNSGDTGEKGHSNNNGFCTNCGAYDPATQNKDGYYEIGNAGQLYWFADKVNNENSTYGSANAVLTADVTVNKGTITATSTDATSWTPIGNSSSQYTGTFDGQGHTVSGLYFNDESAREVGLFGVVGSGGKVSNVGVENSYFNGDYGVGGVCGASIGAITNCYNTGAVSATGEDAFVGGVCGVSAGAITNCYNTGAVSATATNVYVGGVCGLNYGTITNCYSLETEDGPSAVGANNGSSNAKTKTADQFASGEVCYLLNGADDVFTWRQNLGTDTLPTLDQTHGKVYASYPCPAEFSNTKAGIPTVEHEFEDGICTACGAYESEPEQIDGVYQLKTKADLYWFAEQVNSGKTDLDAVLANDITVNTGELSESTTDAKVWTPIGNYANPYTGTFDGQGHTVSGLYFNDESAHEVGLFGALGSGGKVSNVGVENSYFNGDYGVGGVCGYNDRGTITNCYNTGTVSGDDSVGGVCGYNADEGTIANCYNIGAVSATNEGAEVGGVCGVSVGAITNCYNTGAVSATVEDAYVGGVCGWSDGTITNCYNIGAVSGVCGYNTSSGTITNCYYLAATEDENGGKTSNQFHSGEVAYLLAHGTDGEVWGQDLSDATAETLPELNAPKVYKATVDGKAKYHNHTGDTCEYCGDLIEPAFKNGAYQIGTKEDLYWFADYVNSGNTSANAVLTADITVNEGTMTADSTDATSWTPIGNSSSEYTGTFDGQGHTVSGLYFNDGSASNVGLFGAVRRGGKVSNVGVENSYFIGYEHVGGVCGWSAGTITNCYNTGAVSGYDYVGGVCGYNTNSGTITNCYNTGVVSATSDYAYVGGVCGENYIGTITNCYNTGEVSGSGSVGGVCGYNNGGTITNCYNTGEVSGSGSVGGVCGKNSDSGTITNCYLLETEGGLSAVGSNNGSSNAETKTDEQFASGEVAYLLASGTDGSIWGQDLSVETSYPELGAPKVYGDGTTIEYHNHGTSLICELCNGVALSKPEQIGGVYQISNAQELYWFADSVNSGNTSAKAVLTADITVNEGTITADSTSATPWTPIGNSSSKYTGTFDGQGHTVSGLYFNDEVTDYVGLFGYVGNDGKVSNVGVENSYFNGNKYVGGVCGLNYGSITNCYNTSAINGSDYHIGGVCGFNDGGTITNCYNTGAVSGNNYVGGVCGDNDEGAITNCYNTGAVSATGEDAEVGGVCGENYGTITNCYNTGAVSATATNAYVGGVCGYHEEGFITNCYYLTGTASDGIHGSDTEGSAVEKDEATFHSGEVAYLLASGENGSIWGQDLTAAESYPALNGAAVYRTSGCIGYSNSKTAYTEHTYDEDGICTVCGAENDDPMIRLTIDEPAEIVYTGEALDSAELVTADSTGAMTFTWKSGEEILEEDPTDAGEYELIVSIPATRYYGEGTKTFTITITKAEPEYTVPTDLTATYGDTLADVELPEGFAWQDEETTSVGNAGENTFMVTFTPEDTANYNVVEDIEVTIDVAKAEPEYTVPVATATYGDTLADVELPTGFTWQDEKTTSVGKAGENKFKVTFTPEDTDNYNVVEDIEVTIDVAKAAPTVTPIIEDKTYSEGDDIPAISIGKNDTPGTIKWLDVQLEALEAGENVLTWEFTPTDNDNYNVVTGTMIVMAETTT
ncbi:GLUG motif-containing protein, partial [uncultured Ruminococcus sp.]